jgi:hypothetical protein
MWITFLDYLFESGSTLSQIEDSAFLGTGLPEIIVPVSVDGINPFSADTSGFQRR